MMSRLRFALLLVGLLISSCSTVLADGRQSALTSAGKGGEGDSAGTGKKNTQPTTSRKGLGTITVGKETTYVTGSLDKDGYVDYAAALNERLRQGVTPENNANVLLWQAFGPRPEGGKGMPAAFFKWMGMAAPPEEGAYFIDLGRYTKEANKGATDEQSQKLSEQLDRAVQRHWTAQTYPELAAWLGANDKPLALVVEATRRSHYFSPLTHSGGKGPLLDALLPGVQKCRALAQALLARAMLRLGEGKRDAAWQDLRACHRLARLVGRGATLIETLVAIAVDALASRADLAFIEDAGVDARRIEKCLRDLKSLPPLPNIADKMALGERFMSLDNVVWVDRYGVSQLEALSDGQTPARDPERDRMLQGIDWDPALQNINNFYDRVVAALGEKDRAVRYKKLQEIEDGLKELKKKAASPWTRVEIFLAGKKRGSLAGKYIGDVFDRLDGSGGEQGRERGRPRSPGRR